MALSKGDRLGPYEVLNLLGKGGMGEVWKARDTRLGRIVAIKTLDGQHSARFEQEARAIAALNHPHICQIYDIGPDYLVLEYVEGSPLKGPLPPEQAWVLARQIASALEAAHAKGILHRDLKPGNILVNSNGAKLLDFGLAKLVDDADATQTMGIAGTPLYMSPEQVEGKSLDMRSDVFSFGAVLYELLTGRRAFESVAGVLRDEPAPSGYDVIAQCLAKQPAQRLESMARVLEALRDIEAKPASIQPSIAVLPFADMSPGKDQEYFSDGLAEEIINVLTRIAGLKVIARTSAFAFKGKQEDIRRIAEALHVTTVLEGSVRKAGNRLRITAQLISARDGAHLWSERYDREMEDIFAVQDEIAQAIADALQVRLAAEGSQGARYTPRLEAYEAVLRARHETQQWTPESLTRGKDLYLRAVDLDPKYALARCELGLSYFSLATEHVISPQEAAERMSTLAHEALSIDRHLREAHAVLAAAAMIDFQWDTAAHHFRQALAGDAFHSMVSFLYAGFFLPAVGRYADAVAHLDAALRQDPLNIQLRNSAGSIKTAVDDASGAILLERILDAEPNDWVAACRLTCWYWRHGDREKARVYAERSHALVPRHHPGVGALAAILSLTGDERRAASLLEILGDGKAAGAPAGWFHYHMTRGETGLAAQWLEKAIDQHDTRAPYILPRFWGGDFPSTPYWPPLARKMNLPEAAPPDGKR